MYKIQKFNNSISIWYEENGIQISFTNNNEEHPEYQKYLAWAAEGNTAEEYKLGVSDGD